MKGFKQIVLTFFIAVFALALQGQPDRWQQRVEYKMEIDFNVKKHRFTGKQQIVYYNNSPDELDRVFYHLYFNAFQPGSMMDVRSQTIPDSDPRVGSRISALSEDEIGYHKIKSLKKDGKDVKFEVVGTILEVTLDDPIAPNSKATFDMEFESQVPVQIRRSGRDNKEGISYSMSQWYPKMSEYDYQGWHANPYIGREFHGVWGDFDVKISIDKDYTVGGSGYLQNPNEIGHGYEDEGVQVKKKGKKLTWHFIAPNVHDFMWAADPDYTHTKLEREDGMVMHFYYQETETNKDAWAALPKIMDRAFEYINEHFGQYPYDQYSFVQGGDGGMEYPMSTLITGERSIGSLVGVSVHELMHSWYQMVLGTNESLYAWMDEGFTSYASARVMNQLKKEGLLRGKVADDPNLGAISGYANFAKSGMEEPLITHSDHFVTNSAYGVASYVKGAVFMHQLEYVIGKENQNKALLTYFDTWKFKHPNSNDFIRIWEKQSGLELDWYREYMINTTHTIDYGVKAIEENGAASTKVTLEKVGVFPMPLDVAITMTDGTQKWYNIPLRIMRGHKPEADFEGGVEIVEDWPWTHPTYELVIPVAKSKISKVEIDPSGRLADIERGNNAKENK